MIWDRVIELRWGRNLLVYLHGRLRLLRHDELFMSDWLLVRALHLLDSFVADIALCHWFFGTPVCVDLEVD